MRTTIDIPDELFRQVKARAALTGLKLEEYVTEALRASLVRQQAPEKIREAAGSYDSQQLALGGDCVLPLVSGETTEELRSITERRIDELLEFPHSLL